jgi:hypothetical protein
VMSPLICGTSTGWKSALSGHRPRRCGARVTFPAPRPQWTASYTLSVPTEPALGAIAEASPHGVVEVGAGTGYWARLLHDCGVDVVAYDLAPPSVCRQPLVRWGDALVPGAGR